MRAIALGMLVLLASAAVALPEELELSMLHDHVRPDGKPDPGTTAPDSNGDTTTTFGDGWVRTTRADSSYGQGGTILVEKDPSGHVRHMVNYDAKHTQRHLTTADELPDSTIELVHFTYDENGSLLDVRVQYLNGAVGIGSGPAAGSGASSGGAARPGTLPSIVIPGPEPSAASENGSGGNGGGDSQTR